MAKHNVTKKNFQTVLDNIKKDFQKGDNMTQRHWVNELNKLLNNLLSEDFFGTEGQCDPRGDQRD